jgi:hypothetical protein
MTGSRMASTRALSISVVLPTTLASTSLPVDWLRSRTIRGIFSNTRATGCMRVFMICSCRSEVTCPRRWMAACACAVLLWVERTSCTIWFRASTSSPMRFIRLSSTPTCTRTVLSPDSARCSFSLPLAFCRSSPVGSGSPLASARATATAGAGAATDTAGTTAAAATGAGTTGRSRHRRRRHRRSDRRRRPPRASGPRRPRAPAQQREPLSASCASEMTSSAVCPSATALSAPSRAEMSVSPSSSLLVHAVHHAAQRIHAEHHHGEQRRRRGQGRVAQLPQHVLGDV